MSSVSNCLDYDYIVLDSKGRRGVKDGKEYPITEEDWQRAHPEHRNTECKECTFVPDAETLLTFHVSREVRGTASDQPEFVGKFTMPGWSGHSGFYLFRCPDCDDTCIDYPHGYTSEGCLYIRCDHCRFKIVFTPRKYKDVYRREKVVSPPTFWETLKELWRLRKAMVMKIPIEDYEKLQRPLNMEDQKKLKVPGVRVPTDLES